MTDTAGEVGRFRLCVYEGQNTDREALVTREGTGQQWRSSERLRIPGFSDAYSLSLTGFWAELFETRCAHLSRTVTGYETIVKFGNTMQLKREFNVVVDAEFPAAKPT